MNSNDINSHPFPSFKGVYQVSVTVSPEPGLPDLVQCFFCPIQSPSSSELSVPLVTYHLDLCYVFN